MIRALVDGGPANYLAAYRLAEQAERSLPVTIPCSRA